MKKFLSIMAVMLIAVTAYAQRTVKGVVNDAEGEPLPGVNVIVKGTVRGVSSNGLGEFSIEATTNETLVFRYIGYVTKEMAASEANMVVVLDEDLVSLEEIVVVGYGEQKKSDITGSVASVKFEDLKTQPTSDPIQAIQGRVAGVNVVSNSGAPGGSISIRVRGIGTINNSAPLYVVDGIPVESIDFVNPSEISGFEILKDASSCAIYGSRGANGVILITTKSGTKNTAPVLTFESFLSTGNVINNWETTSGKEWVSVQEQLNQTRQDPLDLSNVNSDINTDWFDELTRTGKQQSYNVGISGGTEKSTYSMSLNYFDEDGTITGTSYERVIGRLKTDYQVNKRLKVGTNVNFAKSKKHSILEGSYHTGTLNTAIKIEPIVPVWVDQANGVYGSSQFTDYPNPVAQVAYENANSEKMRFLGNIWAEIELIKNLKFKSSYSYNHTARDSYDFDPVYFVNVNQQNTENKVSRGYSKSNRWVWENTLNYNIEIGDHSISALFGITAEEIRNEWMSASKKNLPNEDESLWYLDAGADGDLAAGRASEVTMHSFLGRLNYSFKDRYLATANFRTDGSSRFAEGNKWANFTSVALGWKITEEEFMQDISWISNLKLRAGWGQIGNQNIGIYPYQSTMSSSSQYRFVFGDEEIANQGYVVIAMKDEDIKWETTESLNIGLDASFMEGKLETSVDWYTKDTKDMLLSVPIPYYYGFESGPVANVGEVNNKGLELAINWRDKVSEDFSYTIGFNVSTYKNEVVTLGAGKPIVGGSYYKGSATFTEEGKPIGYFYGHKTAGVFQSQKEINNWPVQQGTSNEGLALGDMKFVDVNGDGVVNDEDKTDIGNPFPDFSYGINLGASYKEFNLSMFFQGEEGNEIYNAMKTHLYEFDETNKHTDMLNSWTPTNTDTDMPRLNAADKNNTNRASDRFVEDGSYLRLKNVTLGYNLPKNMIEKVGLRSVNIYVSGQNLWTMTDYSGADPEIGQISTTNYLSRGVDIGTFPQAKRFVVGVKLSL